LPATAIVDLALHAGTHLGHPHIDELTLHTPLTLTDTTTYDLRLLATQTESDGPCTLAFHSRASDGADWTHHASVTLTAAAPSSDSTAHAASSESWPPAGASDIDLGSAYDDLAQLGYHYGPRFQGLTAAWRDGDDLYAEIDPSAATGGNGEALPDAVGAYGIHPALLDAALHPLALHPEDGATGATSQTSLPYVFQGVTLHAPRATDAGSALRVRLTKTGPQTLSLSATDRAGSPVVSINSLTLRPQGAPKQATLRQVSWTTVPAPPSAVRPDALLTLGGDVDGPLASLVAFDRRYADLGEFSAVLKAAGNGTIAPEAAPRTVLAVLPSAEPEAAAPDAELRNVLGRALAFLQEWLTEERHEGTHLVLVSRRAVVVRPGEDPDPVQAALWGLIRTAQSEHPQRITLIDLDTHPDTRTALPHALALTLAAGGPPSVESLLAIRQGALHIPRLTRLPHTPTPDTPATTWNPQGTVLITGGTGTLAA
ncbi:polyketide synthase dehydratase domain-containing protein, partial [Streptomyces sp. NPDC056486]|uniref:polyketide synthase dehydratase domain-containing protein n=1 Tax=Streptomyces sp. NPDC056486 TaxID=3345835 RepID=UPI0036CDD3A2